MVMYNTLVKTAWSSPQHALPVNVQKLQSFIIFFSHNRMWSFQISRSWISCLHYILIVNDYTKDTIYITCLLIVMKMKFLITIIVASYASLLTLAFVVYNHATSARVRRLAYSVIDIVPHCENEFPINKYLRICCFCFAGKLLCYPIKAIKIL